MVVPRAAVEVAEKDKVTVQVGLQGLLVNVPVTPVGSPEAEKVTGVVAPVDSLAVTMDDGLVAPWTTVRLLGEGVDRLKSKPGAATVKESVVEWLAPSPAALMVTVAGPSVAVVVAEKDTVTVQVGLHGALVNVAVTPAGRPVAEKVTGVVVPETSVAVIDEEGLVLPWTTVRASGEGVERLKSKGAGETVSDSVVE